MQTNRQYILLGFFALLCCVFSHAQEDKTIPLTVKSKDTLTVTPKQVTTANLAVRDTITNDSIVNDSLPKKKPMLTDKIRYKAKDYVKMSQSEKKIYLYNEAEVYYEDTELKAGIIIIDYTTNEVYAGRIKDSTGNLIQDPYFKQGNNIIEPDSIKFNFNTKKALIWNSKSEQGLGGGGMNVFASLTKKENDSVYFLKEGKLTTSKDVLNPEYYIRIRKAKFVPGKKVIAGFSNMYIADVPTPIAVPFAYFPMSDSRTSGLIFPTFGEVNDRGYFIQNGGYYFVLSPYFDLAVLGDFYTNGSYGFRTESNYRKRYKYNGRLNFRYENQVNSQKGFSDYSRGTQYNIQWSHSQDSKASPNSNFSASVNLGSSKYYKESLNQLNTPNHLNNTLSSSISYSKTFPAYPSINLSLTANHSQNTNTEKIDMTLPALRASMERIFPFAPKNGSKKGILQNINFQYSLTADNKYSTDDDNFFSAKMFEEARTGVRHDIPISTNFKVLKYLSVSVGGSYNDVWAFKTIKKNNYTEENGVVIDTLQGFDRFNKYNYSASIGTTLYGTFNFEKEGRNLKAIRHTVRPSISWGYNPSFEDTYEEYLDKNGDMVRYSPFEGGLYGVPSLNKSNSLGFSLSNSLEAKVAKRDSTGLEIDTKKVMLLNSLNFSSSYNMEADSLKLAPIRMSGGTSILDNKMSINFGATLDPYAIDNNGTRINTFNIDNGGSLVRLSSANANVSYSISSKLFEKDGKKESGKDNNSASGGRNDDLFGRANDFSDSRNFSENDKDKDKKTDDVENPHYGAKIPWDIRFAYAVTYSNGKRQGEISNNSLMFSGNIELSPRWKVGVSSGYDFKNSGFTYTQLRFERDLKSWRLNFNWVPFSTRASWYFFVGIKSSVLSDIKWENRSEPRRNL